MHNEYVFVLSTLADIIFVFFLARRGVDWLLGSIVVNLLLVAVFGAKIITIFGLTTNAGNVFYASVFLATHFILEKGHRKNGVKIIWYGAVFSILFSLLSQFGVAFTGISLSSTTNGALSTLFSFSPRIVLASVLAYIFAQYVNVYLYVWFKEWTRGKFLWFRINSANIVAQLVDSLIFFSIAFFDLPGPLLVQTILIGWFVKTVVVVLGTPFVYIDQYFEHKK